MIPYGHQDITRADIDAVVEVLNSDFLTQGPQVPIFEKKIGTWVDASHVIAVNSATSALHIACLALGLGEGDLLWTSPITFVASANCGLFCGAQVDFVDIDPRTNNLCPVALENKLIKAKSLGRLPKILVPVHFAGRPCDMRAIRKLGEKYGFYIIEDASHAIGSHYLGGPIGSCRYSDITIFSFHPVKIITTGEGGAALTNCPNLAEKMANLRSHGITRDRALMKKQVEEGPWYYEQIALGFNYRMTDLQAALGSSQIDRLEMYIRRRQEIASYYQKHLIDLPLILPDRCDDSAYHLFVVCVDTTKTKKTRAEIFNAMRAQDIGVNVHYIPVHLHPYYSNLGFKKGSFPVAEEYYARAMSIPIYPAMTNRQLETVVDAMHIAFQG
jgi:UDP-4-amino-4,6-dideoxy-N-acetyl-beta-L-altrosamine transaminase